MWGPVRVERTASDEVKGWVVITIHTAMHGKHSKYPAIQIYITKTGKVRIFRGDEEIKVER